MWRRHQELLELVVNLKNLDTQQEVNEVTCFQQEDRNIVIPECKIANSFAGHNGANVLWANVLRKCVIQGANQCFCYVASEGWYWQGETGVFGEEPVQVPLCQIKIQHELAWDWTQYSSTKRHMKRPTERRYESA
jgi:hypothetical protein